MKRINNKSRLPFILVVSGLMLFMYKFKPEVEIVYSYENSAGGTKRGISTGWLQSGLYDVSHDQLQRQDDMRGVCEIFQQNSSWITQATPSATAYLYFKENKINYCHVPNIISVLLSQILHYLEFTEKRDTGVFYLSKVALDKLLLFNTRLEPETDAEVHIVPARDPYARLYYAYVEFTMLPMQYYKYTSFQRRIYPGKELKGIVEIQRKKQLDSEGNYTVARIQCGHQVTFQQFLDLIVSRAKANLEFDRHWAPVNSLCEPCQRKTIFLIKYESLIEDIQTFLVGLGSDVRTHEDVMSAVIDNTMESKVPRLISSILDIWKKLYIESKTCIQGHKIINLLWEFLKIQGFINALHTFSLDDLEEHSNNYLYNENFVINFLMKAVRRSNLSAERREAQRQNCLKRAYLRIEEGTLRNFRDVFMADFMLFNYSITPPV